MLISILEEFTQVMNKGPSKMINDSIDFCQRNSRFLINNQTIKIMFNWYMCWYYLQYIYRQETTQTY